MSALGPTADDAVPAATTRAVPARVTTLQQVVDQHVETVVRA